MEKEAFNGNPLNPREFMEENESEHLKDKNITKEFI